MDPAVVRGCARSLYVAALLALAALPAPAAAQSGYDRPGGDFANFPVRSADPVVCAQRCDRDSRCRAWSFSYPRTVTVRAMCWLKRSVPARVENACCVSGVRGGGVIEPRSGATEFGIDRVGGDYRNFETAPHADGAQCAEACTAEARCRAWTYVRPGYFGPTARCYLKSRVTRPRRKPCCISGVVR
ncbi:MAG TPA: PAN domain-containing protein [Xanthobacteraceae bacterium]|nr:PAN domain-containing protein [Xanthobacteraceae bacterium]